MHVIYYDIRLNGERWRRSSEIEVKKSQWSNGQVKSNHRNHQDLNMVLVADRNKADNIVLKHRLTGEPLNMNRFKQLFDQRELQGSFIAFIELIIQDEAVTESTLKTYRNTLYHLKKCFGDLAFHQVSTMARPFDNYLRKCGLRHNTISKHHKNVRKFARVLIEEHLSLPLKHPYTSFTAERMRQSRDYLTPTQVRRLLKLYYSEEMAEAYHRCLEAFLFACFTGLRFSDFSKLESGHISDNCIIIEMQKTARRGIKVRIPMPKIAQNMILGRKGKLFEVPSTTINFNRNLRECAKAIDLRKHLTSHLARHTYGTLFIAFGGNVAVLQRLLGHTKIETTMNYLHMAESFVDDKVDIFDEEFKAQVVGKDSMDT